jgi:methionyl-tRNA synthetase
MAGRKTYYVTTPIYYVNDAPHIGHAYTTIAADILARFKRLDGYAVKFLTGTDEHGQKVQKTAQGLGITPQELADRNSDNFRALTALLNISNDDFIRTTEGRHVRAVQALWRKLADAGWIYLGAYSGWYSVRDEAYYGEDELCDGPNGQRLAPTGAPVEWVEEPSYFFRLSAFTQPLLDLYERQPDFILPAGKRSEVVSFVKAGLKDLSISRTNFDWGVKAPDDDRHVMYVWLDALTNYLTAAGYPDASPAGEGDGWPADLHLIGKDILRFHAIYWPAFLMAAGLALPKRVFAHGWWTVDGEKMSKSLGNAIKPQAMVEEFGLDQIRYFLMREIPFGNDGDFSRAAIMQRINGELANDYGNLCQRTLAMIQKYYDGTLPAPDALRAEDEALLNGGAQALEIMRAELDRQAFHKALDAIWRVVGEANRYVDEMAPWSLRKTDMARLGTVLYVLAETIRRLALLTQPFMPQASARILDLLGTPEDERDFVCLTSATLPPGRALPPPVPVFPRHVLPTSSGAGQPPV